MREIESTYIMPLCSLNEVEYESPSFAFQMCKNVGIAHFAGTLMSLFRLNDQSL